MKDSIVIRERRKINNEIKIKQNESLGRHSNIKHIQLGSSVDLFCKFGFIILVQKVNR